jgi:hypothetical protein
MAEESTFPGDQQQPPEPPENNSGDNPEVNRQEIFAAKFGELSDEFGRYCQENNIEHAVIIATDGQVEPMIFSNSDMLSTAALMAAGLRPMREEINSMLKVD